MKSIGSKIKEVIVLSLMSAILLFTIISIVLMVAQNRIILSDNEKINSAFEKETSQSLFNAMSGYADDVGQSCLSIIEQNFSTCESLGRSTANFVQMLYTDYYSEPVDTSYGVGFGGGKTPEAIAEINNISDVREYINTYAEYDENDLDNLDIFIVTENGLVIDGTTQNYGDTYEDQRKEQWYIDCKNTRAPLWTGVITGSVTGKQKIDYVTPIMVDNNFMGITVISMEITNLYNSLLKSDFKTIKEIALLNSDGKKIIGSENFDKASADINMLETGVMHMYNKTCWMSYDIPGKDFVICFEFELNALYDTMTNYNKNVAENNNTIRRHTSTLLLFMTVIYIAIALLLLPFFIIRSGRMGRSIVEPLLSLSKKVEDFGKGNMDVDVSDIHTDDEVGLLADTFSEMSENTKKYMTEIQEITAEKERVNAELETASKIQFSLMSSDFPKDEECQVYALMRPAKFVGGDVYASFDIDDDNVLVFVGDVAGKGFPASLISVRTKINIQIYGEMNLGPAETLRLVNNRLCANNDEMLFVTAFLGVFNKKTGVLTYANAGHNKPIIAGENTHFLDMTVGLPLGSFEDMQYKDESVTLKNGESIFIYSDGVPEAMGADGTFYGDDRFLALVEKTTSGDYSAEMLVDAVDNDLKLHYNGKELWDDITMLVLKYTKES